ncbi:MAG: hypothetical protein PUP90_30435 [Nostoc sp. S4]|nr:hypothetical protein [Nostoc sp. S4]
MSYEFLFYSPLSTYNIFRLGSGLPCLLPDLGFPEFESFHLRDFSFKAQLSKSVASTIPPHPRRCSVTIYFVEAANTSSSIPSSIVSFVQLD